MKIPRQRKVFHVDIGNLSQEEAALRVKAIFERVRSFSFELAVAEQYGLEHPKFFTPEMKCSSSKE